MGSGAILLYTAIAEAAIVGSYLLHRLIKKMMSKTKEQIAEEERLKEERRRMREEEARQAAARREEEARRRVEEEKRERERIEEQERQKQTKRNRKIDAIRGRGGLLARAIGNMKNVSDASLEIMYQAAIQRDISFDLSTERALRPVVFPTNHLDFVQVHDVAQFPDVLLSQSVTDDDLFYQMFVDGTLLRTQFYELIAKAKRLYVLLDASPSMWDPERGGAMTFPNGEDGTRDQFARGILASLLSEAVRGEAEYALRLFDDNIGELNRAYDADEAAKLLNWIVTTRVEGSGTNIAQAVKKAVFDIRKKQKDESRFNHILLVTDGDDQRGLTREALVTTLGEDIKLSVVLIGTNWDENHPLFPYIIARY